jgi:hypothetical protein
MARRSEGLKLERRESGLYSVRFTFAGRRYHVPTGERDVGAAQASAARIYEAVVSGRWAPGQRQAAPVTSTPFDEVAARWFGRLLPAPKGRLTPCAGTRELRSSSRDRRDA